MEKSFSGGNASNQIIKIRILGFFSDNEKIPISVLIKIITDD